MKTRQRQRLRTGGRGRRGAREERVPTCATAAEVLCVCAACGEREWYVDFRCADWARVRWARGHL